MFPQNTQLFPTVLKHANIATGVRQYIVTLQFIRYNYPKLICPNQTVVLGEDDVQLVHAGVDLPVQSFYGLIVLLFNCSALYRKVVLDSWTPVKLTAQIQFYVSVHVLLVHYRVR